MIFFYVGLCIVCTQAFINVGGGDCDPRWDTWTVSASANLNHMPENSPMTLGVQTSDQSNAQTGCDVLVGYFTLAGGFGCVIEGGIARDERKYCTSYLDVPVYAYNHNNRRWGTFVALSSDCSDAIRVKRVYMKNNSVGEKYWSYDDELVQPADDIYSVWVVESEQDEGWLMTQDWAYVKPEYEWYAEAFESCSTNCNYEGGVIGRNVVCRNKKPSHSHSYIDWTGDKCAGLDKPAMTQTCPAGSCEWVKRHDNVNCMGSSSTVSNQMTIATSLEQCQSDCANYSYMAWWYHSSKNKCRCYHVCGTASTAGGVYANVVYEQIASSGRRTNRLLFSEEPHAETITIVNSHSQQENENETEQENENDQPED